MALVECYECGSEISEHAASCPKCGFRGNDVTRKAGSDFARNAISTVVGFAAIWFIVGFLDSFSKAPVQQVPPQLDTPRNVVTNKNNGIRYSAIESLSPRSNKIIDAALYELRKEPISARWESVEGDFKGSIFTFTVWYENNPVNIAIQGGSNPDFGISLVKFDAEEVIRAVLKELTHESYNPSEQWISIHAFVNRHVVGETGKPLVEEYGFASYDPSNDSINFNKCDPRALLGC